jgi:hypothetical protein
VGSRHRAATVPRPSALGSTGCGTSLVAVVGGNFFIDCPIAVRVQHIPVVWFGRDDEGSVLVNVQQLTTTSEPRMVMLDNFWISEGDGEHDIECPPSGRLVKASYANGDRLKIEFQSHPSAEDFHRRFPSPKPPEPPAWIRAKRSEMGLGEARIPQRDPLADLGLRFPLTTVAIEMNVEGAGIKLGAQRSQFGSGSISGSWMRGCRVGVQIGDPGTQQPATVDGA